MIVKDEKALVTWNTEHLGSDQDVIVGRFIDLRDGKESSFLSDDIILTESTYQNNNPKVKLFNNNGFLSWVTKSSGSDPYYTGAWKLIKVNWDVENIQVGETHKTDFMGNPYDIQGITQTSSQNILIWEETDGTTTSIKAKIINWRIDERNLFKAPLIERDYSVKAKILSE